jgi:DNA-binding transcriptional regulator YhcF (GntR family)
MLTCDAYLSLSCAARAVLIEIARIYDGTNNGRIALSVRTAAKRCRIADGTANRALDELTERGFIECVRRGSFGYKKRHASEWRITSKPCDVTGELSSKQFMRWRVAEYCQAKKQISVSQYDATVPPIDTVTGLANGSGR